MYLRKLIRNVALLTTMLASSQILAADWSGCYLGANAGYGDGSNQITVNFFANEAFDKDAGSTSSSGSLYGAQFGCDFEASKKWVAGFQLSASKTDISGKHLYFEGTGPENYVRYETDQFLSLSGRLGYLVKDSTLLYSKLGWVTTDQVYTDSDPDYSPPLIFQKSQSRSGWVFGVGVEHKFVENVSFFAELNHVELGTEDNIILIDLGEIDINDYEVSIDQSMLQFMVGINYHF